MLPSLDRVVVLNLCTVMLPMRVEDTNLARLISHVHLNIIVSGPSSGANDSRVSARA
jgi:hypothetical protein